MTQFQTGGFEVHIYDACTQQHLDTNIIFTNPTVMEWSPNDRHLAFTAGANWSVQLFVNSIGDSAVKRIPSLGNDYQSNMAWSPDGDSLIYSGYDQDNSLYASQLYRYHVPSGEQTILAPEFQFADNAIWQPHRNRANTSSACAV
jgi:Tol biopolymer transport system component